MFPNTRETLVENLKIEKALLDQALTDGNPDVLKAIVDKYTIKIAEAQKRIDDARARAASAERRVIAFRQTVKAADQALKKYDARNDVKKAETTVAKLLTMLVDVNGWLDPERKTQPVSFRGLVRSTNTTRNSVHAIQLDGTEVEVFLA